MPTRISHLTSPTRPDDASWATPAVGNVQTKHADSSAPTRHMTVFCIASPRTVENLGDSSDFLMTLLCRTGFT
jgi:hypothetical protein